jgi:hypothetical protein
MSHAMSVEIDTSPMEGVKVEDATLIKNRMEPNEMSVRFLLSADSPEKAYSFATDPALVAEGIRLVSREGLLAAGITERGIPVSCDAQGNPSATLAGSVEKNPNRRYYYLITHKYLGGDD